MRTPLLLAVPVVWSIWASLAPGQEVPLLKLDAPTPIQTEHNLNPGEVLSVECEPCISNLWRVDLLFGLPTGIRAQRALNPDSVWLAEGFVGIEAIFPAVGGGIRRCYVPCQGRRNALLISPGLDAYILFNPFAHGDGAFFGGGREVGGLLAADVDLLWQHAFNRRWQCEVGLKLGAGVGFMERAGVGPIVSLFTGWRF